MVCNVSINIVYIDHYNPQGVSRCSIWNRTQEDMLLLKEYNRSSLDKSGKV